MLLPLKYQNEIDTFEKTCTFMGFLYPQKPFPNLIMPLANLNRMINHPDLTWNEGFLRHGNSSAETGKVLAKMIPVTLDHFFLFNIFIGIKLLYNVTLVSVV